MKSPFKLTLVSTLVLGSLAATGLVHAGGAPESLQAAKTLASAYNDTTDRLIVKYKSSGTSFSKAGEANARAAAASLGQRLGVGVSYLRRTADGAQVLKLDSARPVAEMADLARQIQAEDSNIAYAEPDRMMRIQMTPNDSRYSEQWDLFEATGGINVVAAWDKTTAGGAAINGAGVTVAVIDTGYRPHADLAANLLPGYDMITDTSVSNDGNGRDSDASDPGDWVTANQCGGTHSAQNSSWHGTHVAGTVSAVTNNASGMAGIAFGAKVVPVRVLGTCGGYTSDIADGIIWASGGSVSGVTANANPAKVINMSLGGSGACDTTTQNAINSARSRGTVIVIAAGNDNDNANNYNPGNCAGVVNVAATTRQGGRASFSNYGTSVDLAAPGVSTLSTLNSGTTTPGSDSFANYSGTSMAAPHVAGIAALVAQAKPGATPDEIESILKTTTRAFPATCTSCGTGIVDTLAAVNSALGTITPPPPSGDVVLANGVAVASQSGATGSSKYYSLVVPAGASQVKFTTTGGTGDADIYVRAGTKPTTSSYTCKSDGSTSTETCTITNPAAGTYYMLMSGYSAYSGVTVTGSYTVSSGPVSYENTTDYAIPDNNSTGISSSVSVTRTGASNTVSVDVNVVHPYIGDLVVDLIAPSGTVYNLHNRTGSSADNIVKTYSVNAGTTASNGTWKLRVKDMASQDVGYINSWKLTFAN
ncbi:MAG: S8 family serine peptidase [Gammaproteobacteria bacterium]|nr:S8 family serine peptidase [Gammaproteobacteria bacterium]